MIFDTFIFFNEIELLDIRLNILNDCVDRFVLVEATKTFQGKHKPLFFEQSKHLFERYKDKIIHVVVDDLPVNAAPFDREYFQRDAILRGLDGCGSEDLIIISDLDEIPNPEVIPKYLEKG
ncbi:MAG: glycosyl transferase GT17 family protein, partial [Chlorobium sp.]|nr:glycosyl transferase GT17 family protein [Chlorobium sp.]